MPKLTNAQLLTQVGRLQRSLKRERTRRQELELALRESAAALKREQAARSEALEQQTATSEILRMISSSPTDVQPELEAVVTNAALLCEARDASLYRVEDSVLQHVARHGTVVPWEGGSTLPRLGKYSPFASHPCHTGPPGPWGGGLS